MRCPKCGYISFDRLEKCLNCNKDIEAVSSSLSGSNYNIQAPSYLNLNRVKKDEPSEHLDLSEEHSFGDDDEYLDEELEILVGDDDTDIEEELTFAEDDQIGLEASAEDEGDEEREIEFDFSQFEDEDEDEEGEVEVEGEPAQEVKESLAMEIPEELSDMSDLAPPAESKEAVEQPPEKPAGTEMSDMDLDDLHFDLGLDDMDGEVERKPGVPEEVILALDEIDFSETLGESESGSSASKESDDMDMDEDLNFDLDLGGLSIHDDR